MQGAGLDKRHDAGRILAMESAIGGQLLVTSRQGIPPLITESYAGCDFRRMRQGQERRTQRTGDGTSPECRAAPASSKSAITAALSQFFSSIQAAAWRYHRCAPSRSHNCT